MLFLQWLRQQLTNSKSEIRQLLPMSFLSKSWEPSFDLVGHCLSPVSLGDFLRKKAFSRNPEMAVITINDVCVNSPNRSRVANLD